MDRFNRNLAFFLALLLLLLCWRLGMAALETDNWRGFVYSTMQLLIVAGTAFIALKKVI